MYNPDDNTDIVEREPKKKKPAHPYVPGPPRKQTTAPVTFKAPVVAPLAERNVREGTSYAAAVTAGSKQK